MAARKPQSGFNWKLIVGIVVVGGAAYFLTGGNGDSTSSIKGSAAAAKTTSGTANDDFLPADYKASFPILKVDPKDAFQPLIKKAVVSNALLGDKAITSSITGGGNWSYNGMVQVDGATQGLMEDTKSGEADYISVGQHWKHGKVKRITDSEIVFAGDDGHSATLKMGDSSLEAAKSASVPNPNAPVAVAPPVNANDLNVTPLPAADAGGNNNGGGGFRRRRGRGGFGGFGGFGNGQ